MRGRVEAEYLLAECFSGRALLAAVGPRVTGRIELPSLGLTKVGALAAVTGDCDGGAGRRREDGRPGGTSLEVPAIGTELCRIAEHPYEAHDESL